MNRTRARETGGIGPQLHATTATFLPRSKKIVPTITLSIGTQFQQLPQVKGHTR